jgi:transketolase C-terminal domain/subunit
VIGPQPNREMYGKTLVELGERNPRVVVLDADVAKSTNTYRFRDRFPDRFFDLGNVKIVATNAGVEICGDGVTHQGVEDLAVTRAIANMVVLAPSDPVMTRKATLAIADYDGPVYMRLGRQVAQALRAADELARLGIQARVLDCPTIKPIDREEILAAAREAFLNQDAASKNFLRTCAQQAASTTFDPPTPWWAACPSVCKIPSNPARNRRGPSRLRPRRKSNTPPR